MAGTWVHANGNGVEVRFWLSGKAVATTTGGNRTNSVGLFTGHGQKYTDARQRAKKYKGKYYYQHTVDFAGF
jgi:hypothetical protein